MSLACVNSGFNARMFRSSCPARCRSNLPTTGNGTRPCYSIPVLWDGSCAVNEYTWAKTAMATQLQQVQRVHQTPAAPPVGVQSTEWTDVSAAEEVQELMKLGYTYIDVRQPSDFKAGHVPGAINMPLGPELPQQIEFKFPDPKEVIVGCKGGKFSTKAVTLLAESGVNMDGIVNFKGGLIAWSAARLPVVVEK